MNGQSSNSGSSSPAPFAPRDQQVVLDLEKEEEKKKQNQSAFGGMMDMEIDIYGAQETFDSVTKPYEQPKIGKALNDAGLTREEKEQTLNAMRSEAQRDWEAKRKASITHSLDSIDFGLTDAEVQRLLETDGYNELEQRTPPSFFVILFKQCINIVPIVMWFQCFLYFFLAQIMSALGYLTTGIAVVGVAAFGEHRSAKNCCHTDDDKQEVAVHRNGQVLLVKPRELVRGDVIELSAGDYVPADCRVLDSVDLAAIEMTLTGEPHDINKRVLGPDEDPDAKGKNMFPYDVILSSTVLSSGRCTALVFATGMGTKVGNMAQELVQEKEDIFPLQRSINRFGTVCTVFAICFATAISLVLSITSYQEPLHQERGEFGRVLSCLIVGVSAGFQALPIAILPVTLFLLSRAVFQLKKEQCQVKRPSSIDVLGCVTVVCSDKTGTISSGKMTAVKLATFDDTASGKEYEFYPFRGFHPNGGLWKQGALTSVEKTMIDESFDSMQDRTDYQAKIREIGSRALDIADEKNHDKMDTFVPRTCMMAMTLNSYSTKFTKEEQEDSLGHAKMVWDIEGLKKNICQHSKRFEDTVKIQMKII